MNRKSYFTGDGNVSDRHDPRPVRGGCCHDSEFKIVSLHGQLNFNMYVIPRGVEIITLVNSGDPIPQNINWVTYFEDFLKNKGPLFNGDTRGLSRVGKELQDLLNFETHRFPPLGLQQKPSPIQIRRNLPGDVINNQAFRSHGAFCDDEIYILTPVTKRLGNNTTFDRNIVQSFNKGKLQVLYPDDEFLDPEHIINSKRKNCSITCLNGTNLEVVDVACKPDTPEDIPLTISQKVTYNFSNGRSGQIVPYPDIDFKDPVQQHKTLSNFIRERKEIYYYVKYDDGEYGYLPASSIRVGYNLDSLVNQNGKGTYIILSCRGKSSYETEMETKELQDPKNQIWGGAQLKTKLGLQEYSRNNTNLNTDNRIYGSVHALRENLRLHGLLGYENYEGYTKVGKNTPSMSFIDGAFLEYDEGDE